MVAAKAGSGPMIIVGVSGNDADSVRSICSQGNARPRRRRRSTIACDVGVGNLVSRFFLFCFWLFAGAQTSLGKRCIGMCGS